MRINKKIMVDILNTVERNIDLKPRYRFFARNLSECIKKLPGEELELCSAEEKDPDICIKGGKRLFENLLKYAADAMEPCDRRNTYILRIIRELNEFPCDEMVIYSPNNNCVAIQKWEEKDVKAAFLRAGIVFTKEKYEKLLPDILDIIHDRSDVFDKISNLIEETFSADKDPKVLWKEFGRIKKDRISRKIAEPWKHFPEGTSELTVWNWFEKEFGIGIEELIYQ